MKQQAENGITRLTAAPRDVDAYIDSAPAATQPMLRQLRALIRSVAPQAKERISYGMPDYEANGPLCNFATYKNHVALYGVVHADNAVPDKASAYLKNRSTLRFEVGRPLPVELIKKALTERVKSNKTAKVQDRRR